MKDRVAMEVFSEPLDEQEPRALKEIRELDELTTLGNVYLAALMRKHLKLSVTASLSFVFVLCMIPIVADRVPSFSSVSVLGIPLPWALLWFGSYPLMLGLGWYYVHTAERIDDEFSDLMQ
ncbi:MAG: hypothetical protein ACYDGR_09260 [Candidatus Dormibacteria bacterium]